MSQNGAVLTRWVNFFPRTQQTVTMSLVPIFIKPIAICRPVRLKSVQFRCFIPDDPLAKAAKLAGFDICWLDFTKVPENSELGRQASEYTYGGTLGESYSIIMRLLLQVIECFNLLRSFMIV